MIIDIKKSNNHLINLDKDTSRLKNSKHILNLLNIEFNRFEGVKHSRGIIGCGMSHLAALKNNISNINHNGLMILEDDIALVEGQKDTVFDIPDDTDALYLGVSRFGYVRPASVGIYDAVLITQINKNYKRIFNMCSTHAVVYISKKYIDAVINVIDFCLQKDIAFDLGIASIHRHFNILTPNIPLFYQDNQPDATNTVLIY